MKKDIYATIKAAVNVALDLAVFLLCLDAWYTEIGVICAAYVAVAFLAPHCTRLSVSAGIAYDEIAVWAAKRKEEKLKKAENLELETAEEI